MIDKIENRILSYVNERGLVSEVELLDLLLINSETLKTTIYTKINKIDNSEMDIKFPFPIHYFDILRRMAEQGEIIICFDVLYGIPLNNLDGLYFEDRVLIKKGKEKNYLSRDYPDLNNCVILSKKRYSMFSEVNKKKLLPFIILGGKKNDKETFSKS